MKDSALNGADWERAHFYRLIWLFPAVYVFHISEEGLGFPRWVTNVLHGAMNVRAFYVNNAVFMAILLALCALATRTRARWALWLLFIWAAAQEFCNAVFHVYSQVVFKAYSPGLFTAVFLYIPTFGYLTYLVLRERLLPRWFLVPALSVGALGMAFTIWAGLYHFGAVPWCQWAPFASSCNPG
jgi:Protein of unknown function with HXXEE motif